MALKFFFSHANKIHFHKKVLHSLALKVRVFGPTAYWKNSSFRNFDWENNVNEVSFCFLSLVSRWEIGALTRVKLELGLINRPLFLLRPAYARQGQARTQDKKRRNLLTSPILVLVVFAIGLTPPLPPPPGQLKPHWNEGKTWQLLITPL